MQTLPVFFAPLQGYTEAAFRNAHAACFGGVDAYFSPFVRVEKGGFRSRDLRDVEPSNNSVPRLLPQLIASSAEQAAAVLELFVGYGYKEANINLGCPFPPLAKRYNGSGMLPYPDRVRELLEVASRYPQVSLSVKMRLGWESADESVALLPVINDAPLQYVVVHPRVGRQQYKGEVDMDGFRKIYSGCRHPVVYNGDVSTVDDICRLQDWFPDLHGVMVGRGLLANPALALEYAGHRHMDAGELRERLRCMHSMVFAAYSGRIEGGDSQLLGKMKAFWEYLAPCGGKKQAKAILKSTTVEKYRRAVDDYLPTVAVSGD